MPIKGSFSSFPASKPVVESSVRSALTESITTCLDFQRQRDPTTSARLSTLLAKVSELSGRLRALVHPVGVQLGFVEWLHDHLHTARASSSCPLAGRIRRCCINTAQRPVTGSAPTFRDTMQAKNPARRKMVNSGNRYWKGSEVKRIAEGINTARGWRQSWVVRIDRRTLHRRFSFCHRVSASTNHDHGF